MAEDWEVAFGRLEERMKTMQAEYKTDIALLAKELADGRTEAAQRETSLVDRMTVRVGIGVAILGAMLAAIRYLP